MKLSAKEELEAKAKNGSYGGYPRLFSDDGGWSELKDGGYSGGKAMYGDQDGGWWCFGLRSKGVRVKGLRPRWFRPV